jgi:hypothetical protein
VTRPRSPSALSSLSDHRESPCDRVTGAIARGSSPRREACSSAGTIAPAPSSDLTTPTWRVRPRSIGFRFPTPRTRKEKFDLGATAQAAQLVVRECGTVAPETVRADRRVLRGRRQSRTVAPKALSRCAPFVARALVRLDGRRGDGCDRPGGRRDWWHPGFVRRPVVRFLRLENWKPGVRCSRQSVV